VRVFKSRWEQQQSDREKAGKKWETNGLVFTDTLGRAIDGSTLAQAFKVLVKNANLPPRQPIIGSDIHVPHCLSNEAPESAKYKRSYAISRSARRWMSTVICSPKMSAKPSTISMPILIAWRLEVAHEKR
jgi:hypothetical protein